MNRADPAQARLQCRRVERAIVGRDRVQALDDVIEHPTMIGDGVRSTRRIVSGERAVAVEPHGAGFATPRVPAGNPSTRSNTITLSNRAYLANSTTARWPRSRAAAGGSEGSTSVKRRG